MSSIGPVVSEEKMFENVDGRRTDDGRTTDAGVFVFVALRPMSTAMVIAGRSVHLTTLFPGQA